MLADFLFTRYYSVKMSDWRLAVSTEVLAARSSLYQQIRQFFFALNYLEVETPLLATHTVSDLHLHSFKTENFYLQTSPEYAMKRLLASGQGSMFQICKAFRQGESGSRHQPEFSILEWYAVDLDDVALITQVQNLLREVLACDAFSVVSYREAFIKVLAVDPHLATTEVLRECLQKKCPQLFQDLFVSPQQSHKRSLQNEIVDHASVSSLEQQLSRSTLLELLFTHVVESGFDPDIAMIVYDWPSEQAALARIEPNEQGQLVAKRFELYYKGVELANAYYECDSSVELEHRFEQQNLLRRQQGLPVIELDKVFIESQDYLPKCSGIALGLDRLLMVKLGLNDIHEVMALPFQSASGC